MPLRYEGGSPPSTHAQRHICGHGTPSTPSARLEHPVAAGRAPRAVAVVAGASPSATARPRCRPRRRRTTCRRGRRAVRGRRSPASARARRPGRRRRKSRGPRPRRGGASRAAGRRVTSARASRPCAIPAAPTSRSVWRFGAWMALVHALASGRSVGTERAGTPSATSRSADASGSGDGVGPVGSAAGARAQPRPGGRRPQGGGQHQEDPVVGGRRPRRDPELTAEGCRGRRHDPEVEPAARSASMAWGRYSNCAGGQPMVSPASCSRIIAWSTASVSDVVDERRRRPGTGSRRSLFDVHFQRTPFDIPSARAPRPPPGRAGRRGSGTASGAPR